MAILSDQLIGNEETLRRQDIDDLNDAKLDGPSVFSSPIVAGIDGPIDGFSSTHKKNEDAFWWNASP